MARSCVRRYKPARAARSLLLVVLCLMAIALLIMTADSSPTWIYQGF